MTLRSWPEESVKQNNVSLNLKYHFSINGINSKYLIHQDTLLSTKLKNTKAVSRAQSNARPPADKTACLRTAGFACRARECVLRGRGGGSNILLLPCYFYSPRRQDLCKQARELRREKSISAAQAASHFSEITACSNNGIFVKVQLDHQNSSVFHNHI